MQYRGTILQLEGPGVDVDLVKLEEGLQVVDEVRHGGWPRPTVHCLLTVNSALCRKIASNYNFLHIGQVKHYLLMPLHYAWWCKSFSTLYELTY